jgi:hypothetical protein
MAGDELVVDEANQSLAAEPIFDRNPKIGISIRSG